MKIVAFVMALLLFGCASDPKMESDGSSSGFGTLAEATDPVDMAAAPVVNKLATYTHTVASYLKTGYINKDRAIFFRMRERTARAQLEQAIASHSISDIQAIGLMIDGYFNELVGK